MKSISAMKRKTSAPDIMTCTLIVVLIFISAAGQASAAENYRHFNSLKGKLVADGFDKCRIDILYRDPSLKFSDDIAGSYFRHREGKLNYKQFTSKNTIEKAKIYMAEHKAELARVVSTVLFSRPNPE